MSVNPAWRNQHTDLVVGKTIVCIDCERTFVKGGGVQKRCSSCAHKFKVAQVAERMGKTVERQRARREAERRKNDEECAKFLSALLKCSARRALANLQEIRERLRK